MSQEARGEENSHYIKLWECSKGKKDPPPPKIRSEDAYDIPRVMAQSTHPHPDSGVGVPISTRVPLRPSRNVTKKLDDMYDFPRVMAKSAEAVDLNTPVPLSNSLRPGKHLYLNSAPGFFSNKETVFNYDYRPSLPIPSDEATDVPARSPRSSGNDVTPPAVNRHLKPRPKTTGSPTSPIHFYLSPPPSSSGAMRKKVSNSDDKKKSRRVHREPEDHPNLQYLDLDLDSDNSSPRTPNLIESGVGIHHQKTPSSSSVGSASGRSSCITSGDIGTYQNPGYNGINNGGIMITHAPNNSCNSSSGGNSKSQSQSPNSVYKTVDFVRTLAFNKLRLKTEKDHQKPH